jgi:hypothetical protein
VPFDVEAVVAAQGQVLLDERKEVWRHPVTSGHWRATSESAGTSSLA